MAKKHSIKSSFSEDFFIKKGCHLFSVIPNINSLQLLNMIV